MSESEDRTQPASKPRREQARAQGQVAHSPELSSAAGLLATVVAISFVGDELVSALVLILREAIGSMAESTADVEGVSTRVRGVWLGLARPMGIILLAGAGVSVIAHQFQVRGLFAPTLLAPDLGRLWTPGRGAGTGTRLGQSAWGWVKALVLIAVSGWVIRAGWLEMLRASELSGAELTRAAGAVLINAIWPLSGLLLVLGTIEYGLRYQRFEAMLRMTAQEQREDQRTIEGDPAIRAERRRLMRMWRSDSPDLFTGASLLLLGSGGLTLVISGGPPPARIQVRTVAKGSAGLRLRRSSRARDVPRVDAPELARRLSIRPVGGAMISSDLMTGLALLWPKDRGAMRGPDRDVIALFLVRKRPLVAFG